jgi:hypothetical protein
VETKNSWNALGSSTGVGFQPRVGRLDLRHATSNAVGTLISNRLIKGSKGPGASGQRNPV